MIRKVRSLSRFAMFGVLAAALAVSACGRKGPLDAPPGGGTTLSHTDQPKTVDPVTGQQVQQNTQGNNVISRGGASGLPRVRGEDKRIPLDALLN